VGATQEVWVQTSPPIAPRRWRRCRRCGAALGRLIAWFIGIVMSIWALLAIHYANLSGRSPRTLYTVIFGMALLASVILIRPRKFKLAALAGLIGGVLVWYFSIQPSNERDWTPDVARTAVLEINGNELTVHNVRDCDWRSDDNFTPHWNDRTFHLSDLQTVDLLFCHWGSKAIAHGIVSFGFADGRHLDVSVEMRREKSETSSMIQSFFRQYELVYVFADERDVVRVRTNVRKEDVYLYETNIPQDKAKALLLSYAKRANHLAAHPEFYNALTSNCITNIVHIAKVVNPSARISWEMLLSGYAPRQAYRNGRLDTSMSFEALQAQSLISKAAQAANDDPEFSKSIRRGLPDPNHKTQPSAQTGVGTTRPN
jgi:hypothetical protein